MRYTVLIERGETSYGAWVPDLPGCVAAAESVEEVEQLIRQAIVLHIEALRRRSEPVPVPATQPYVVEVA